MFITSTRGSQISWRDRVTIGRAGREKKKSNHVSNSGTNFKKMFFKVLFVIGIMLPEISSDIVDLNSKLIIWYFWICDS